MKKKFEKCPAQLVEEFFEGNEEKTRLWWITPNPLLGGLRPTDMLKTSRGEKKLERFIRNSMDENEQ